MERQLEGDEMLKYFNCLTKDCTDGPKVPGRPCVGTSLASLFPQLVKDDCPWSRCGNVVTRHLQAVTLSAAAASAEIARQKASRAVNWADEYDLPKMPTEETVDYE